MAVSAKFTSPSDHATAVVSSDNVAVTQKRDQESSTTKAADQPQTAPSPQLLQSSTETKSGVSTKQSKLGGG